MVAEGPVPALPGAAHTHQQLYFSHLQTIDTQFKPQLHTKLLWHKISPEHTTLEAGIHTLSPSATYVMILL
jgi:hypothetical protein